jgi:hypothetical protein
MDAHFSSLDRLGHRRGALAFACVAFGLLYLVIATISAPPIAAGVAAALRFDLSRGAGLAATFAPVIALWLVLRHLYGTAAFAGLLLLFPGIALGLATGGTGMVAAALFGGAVLTLETRPALAGVLVGLLAYRPDLAVLAVMALLFGRHWRALAAAAATLAALVLAGIAVAGWFAVPTKFDFIAGIPDAEAMLWARAPTVYAATRLIGGDMLIGRLLQVAASIAAVAVVGATWIRRAPLAWRGSTLALAFLLATPHGAGGDLVLLVFPLGWLMQHMAGEDSGAGEEFLVAIGWFAPALFWVIALAGGPPTMPLVLAALTLLVWRRAFPARRLASQDAVA